MSSAAVPRHNGPLPLGVLPDELAAINLAAEVSGVRLGALSSAVVRLLRDHYGRGPTKATSLRLHDGYVVTVLEQCLTRVELTLVEKGHAALVHELRSAFDDAMAAEFTSAAEQALGRQVVAHQSQLVPESNICFEIFLLADDR